MAEIICKDLKIIKEIVNPKVMIGNHEITDYASFMKVAEENEKLQQENKELKERLDRMTFLFGLDDSSQETVFEKLENEIEQLQQENQQYKNAWEELKEYITKENITIQGVEVLEQEDLIDKIEELEQKHNLDNKQVSIVERVDE